MKRLSLYSKRPNFVIGFHGCDKSVATNVVCGNENLKASMNGYDWLGNGIYFWENNLERAFEWAKKSKMVKEPAVIGAVINLGYCMDLMDSEFLKELKVAYKTLEESIPLTNKPMPANVGATQDKLIRRLDCAVIQTAHKINEYKSASYDSVRGVFWEGKELYPNAFFKEGNHIQICVRNPNCIKGYFLPRMVDDEYIIP